MDRRGFLKMLGLAIPVAAAAPSYFFAPAGGWYMGGVVPALGMGNIQFGRGILSFMPVGETILPKSLIPLGETNDLNLEICRVFNVSPSMVLPFGPLHFEARALLRRDHERLLKLAHTRRFPWRGEQTFG